VVHATTAIVIGVLLLTKLAIIRLFPHFSGALPTLGLGLLINTVILGSLSLPYALRAHTISGDTLGAPNLERVRGVHGRPAARGHRPGALVSRGSARCGHRP
jgi:hypothetical protein